MHVYSVLNHGMALGSSVVVRMGHVATYVGSDFLQCDLVDPEHPIARELCSDCNMTGSNGVLIETPLLMDQT